MKTTTANSRQELMKASRRYTEAWERWSRQIENDVSEDKNNARGRMEVAETNLQSAAIRFTKVTRPNYERQAPRARKTVCTGTTDLVWTPVKP